MEDSDQSTVIAAGGDESGQSSQFAMTRNHGEVTALLSEFLPVHTREATASGDLVAVSVSGGSSVTIVDTVASEFEVVDNDKDGEAEGLVVATRTNFLYIVDGAEIQVGGVLPWTPKPYNKIISLDADNDGDADFITMTVNHADKMYYLDFVVNEN